MRKHFLFSTLSLLSILSTLSAAPYAALVGVDSNNIIIPPNGAASISMLASNAAAALAEIGRAHV
jgi:hypothetical protein